MNEDFSQFSLKKIKYIQSVGNVQASIIMEEVRGQEIYQNKNKIETNKLPHPDFVNLLTQMIPMLKRVFMYEGDECIQVTGISITGFEETKAVIIMGTVTAPSGIAMAINTHKIELSSDIYAFEEELGKIVKGLEKEVFEYLFKGKKAQLELFDPLENE